MPNLYVIFLQTITQFIHVGQMWNQRSLQEALNDVSKWCDQNRMVVHPRKAKSMVLASRQKHQLKLLILNLTDTWYKHNWNRVLGITTAEELKR